MIDPNKRDVKEFLEFLFKDYQDPYFLEVRLITKENKIIQKFFSSIEEAYMFLQKEVPEDVHVFVGVNPRCEEKGTSNSVKQSCILFADFDSGDAVREYYNIYSTLVRMNIPPSLIVKSGKGIHIYWKLKESVSIEEWKILETHLIDILKSKFEKYCVDEKVKDPARVLRVPGFPNPKYDDERQETKILLKEPCLLNPNIIDEIHQEIKLKKEKSISHPTSTTRTKEKKLSDKQIKELVELFVPIWKEGHRNKLTYSLCGWLIKNGFSEDSVHRLIDKITTKAKDEEKTQRMYLVKYHFEKKIIPEIKETIDKLKGITGIEEVLLELFGEDSYPKVDEFLRKIKKIANLQTNFVFAIVKEEWKRRTKKTSEGEMEIPCKNIWGFVNAPGKGILRVKLKEEKSEDRTNRTLLSREYLSDFYISSCKILINPISNEEIYSVEITYPTRKKRTFEGNLEDIKNTLTREKGTRNSAQLKDAISSILSEFEKKGIAEIKEGFNVTGFFLYKNRLIWHQSKNSSIALPEPSQEKLKEALLTLNEFAKWYDFKKFLPIVATGIISPLGFVRKQKGTPNHIVILNGHPGTGKTHLVRLVQSIWGIKNFSPPFELTGSALKSEFRMGYYLSQSTLPIGVHEAYSVLIDAKFSELMKNLATEEILRSWEHQQKRFYGYAKLYLTFNYGIPMEIDPGLLERRLIVVTFSKSDEPSLESKEKFRKLFQENRNKLGFIGSYLVKWYCENWEKIKEIILDEDEINAGTQILQMLYKEVGLDIPEWLKVDPEIEDIKIDFSTDFYIFHLIREDLLNMANSLRFTSSKEAQDIDSPKDFYEEMINFLKSRGCLPTYLAIGEDNVYIAPEVIREVEKRFRISVPGGLKSLAERLGYKYAPRKIGKLQKSKKVMVVPFREFLECITQE